MANAPHRVWSRATVRPSAAVHDIPVVLDHVFHTVRRLSDCGGEAARSCAPWAMSHTTRSGLPRFAYRRHADHGSPGVSVASPRGRRRTIALRERLMDRGRHARGDSGPLLTAAPGASWRTACAPAWPGRMVGLTGLRQAPGGPRYRQGGRHWTPGTATKPDPSRMAQGLLAV